MKKTSLLPLLLFMGIQLLTNVHAAGTDPANEQEPGTKGFYLGAGYSYIEYDLTKTTNTNGTRTTADRNTYHDALMIMGGYKFNSYVALEGRYWEATDEDFKLDNGLKREKTLDAWGIYLKPMFPVTDKIDVYGLLGYAEIDSAFKAFRRNGTVNDQDLSDEDFSWGVGFSFRVLDNLSISAEYIQIYDDKQSKHLAAPLSGSKDWDITLDSYSVGLAYHF